MIAYKSIGQTYILKLSDFDLMKTIFLQIIIIAVFVIGSPLRCFGTQNRHFQSCN